VRTGSDVAHPMPESSGRKWREEEEGEGGSSRGGGVPLTDSPGECGFNFPISRTVTLPFAAVRPEYFRDLPAHRAWRHDSSPSPFSLFPGTSRLFKIPAGVPSSVLKITLVRLVCRGGSC